MPSRIATAIVVIGILAFGSAGAFAAVGHVNGARSAHQKALKKAERKHHKARHVAGGQAAAKATAPSAAAKATLPAAAPASSRSAAAQEYGTRPGKGCGDKNHDHTGPPGNPGNTDCPHHP